MYKTIIVNPPKHFYFLISTFISVSQGRVSQRYLGMTAAMTQIPVPTATTFINQTVHSLLQLSGKFRYERCVSVQAL